MALSSAPSAPAVAIGLAMPQPIDMNMIGIITEGLTGAGIAHQIGLGALVDGYAACRTQFLPFCF